MAGIDLEIHLGLDGISISERIASLVDSISFIPSKTRPAQARNQILQNCLGDWIHFIDDDATVDPNYFETFLTALSLNPKATFIGGPNLTPNSSSPFQRAAGMALSSRFGTAKVADRYRQSGNSRQGDDHNLILCNLFILKNAFETFPPDFICCEENWVIWRGKQKGHLMIHFPDLFVWHERREGFRQFFRQNLNYGVGRGQMFRRAPKSFRWYHLIPLLSLALAVLFPQLLFLYLACALGFSILSLGRTRESPRILPLIGLMFPSIHLSYGTGLIIGLLKKNAGV